MARTRKDRKDRRDKGFSLIELLVVVIVIMVIVAIAVPSLLRARAASDNSGAAGEVKTFNSAALNYVSSWNVSPALAADMGGLETGKSAGAAADAELATAIAAQLDKGMVQSGFTFNYSVLGSSTGVGGTTGGTGYEFTAVPVTPGSSGTDAFCADNTGLYHTADGTGAAGQVAKAGCNTDGYTHPLGQ